MNNCEFIGMLRVVDGNGDKYTAVDRHGNIYDLETNEDVMLFANDVIEKNIDKIRVLHRGDEEHVTLFLTNKCNSNCIMCPDSEGLRKRENDINIERVYEFIDVLPENIFTFDITGGEPTLLRQDLYFLIYRIFCRFPEASLMLITNGRAFYDKNYALSFKKLTGRNFRVEIPLHSHRPEMHDYIAGMKGSFEQTYAGLRNLCGAGIKSVIRVVVSRLNVDYLKEISKFVHEEFPQITYINFMGMEVMGNAYKNKDEVWVEYDDIKYKLQDTLKFCLSVGINPQLYNFPLCMFEEKYWSFYRRSITPSKVKYLHECEMCTLKNSCGGFFNSTIVNTSFFPKPYAIGGENNAK